MTLYKSSCFYGNEKMVLSNVHDESRGLGEKLEDEE
jgi:hypothetical protein